ncbi:MAG TPA: hypothetical protein VFT16_00960 [Candidatus Saccharimonadales bacterium]|nr:hypothetical protein [Candidatus Saccharimonadales bacterium]
MKNVDEIRYFSATPSVGGPQSASLARSLPDPDDIFPPIPADKLVDGRTREGKEQRAYLARRRAYTDAYRMARHLEGNVFHAQTQRDTAIRAHDRSLMRYIHLCMAVAFQLCLVLQRRPEQIHQHMSRDNGLTVNFTLDDLSVVITGDQQSIELQAPGMTPQKFWFNVNGNLIDESFDRLIGYLARAGYKIDPANAKKALTADDRAALYEEDCEETPDSFGSVPAAIGRFAIPVAGITPPDGEPSGNKAMFYIITDGAP